MDAIDIKAWDMFCAIEDLTTEQADNEKLCLELRKSYLFAKCRLNVAMNELISQLLTRDANRQKSRGSSH